MTNVRSTNFPNANSPQLLTRLLEAVSRGVRTTRGLQETLGVQSQTARYYIHAGEWLDLCVDQGEVELTPLGLEYVFAGPRRPWVYVRAVWSNPFAAAVLMGGDGRLPDGDSVERAMRRQDPDLADATIRRRASAVRSLIAPAVGRPRPRARDEEERQLGLPLAHPSASSAPRVRLYGDREYNPDAYRITLTALLDHGELSLGSLRALLDRSGGTELPLGGFVDMAVSRGDAVRIDERLVVTPAAIERQDLVSTTPSIMLSDPLYRAYLRDVAAAPDNRSAGVRRDAFAARFRAWDRRLFGHPVRIDRLAHDLEAVLMDRAVDSFPLAQPGATPPPVVREPFLDVWARGPLLAACPPSLAQLQGGVAAVNRVLQTVRRRGELGLVGLGVRPTAVHGAILHPGEPVPRSVPDARSLRLRLLMHAPYPSVLTALLLLHRLHPDAISLQHASAGLQVMVRHAPVGDPLVVVDRFGTSQGWVMCRRPQSGIDAQTVVRSLEVAGIAVRVGRLVVLEERFFHHLAGSPDEQEVAARIRPLADALQAWLDAAAESGE